MEKCVFLGPRLCIVELQKMWVRVTKGGFRNEKLGGYTKTNNHERKGEPC